MYTFIMQGSDLQNNKTTKQKHLANEKAESVCKSAIKIKATNERGGCFCYVVSFICKSDPCLYCIFSYHPGYCFAWDLAVPAELQGGCPLRPGQCGNRPRHRGLGHRVRPLHRCQSISYRST